MFVVTFRDQFGLKKCVYGNSEYGVGQTIPGEPKCYCNSKGVVVCDTQEIDETGVEISDYSSDDINFSSKFLNLLDVKSNFQKVRFSDVTSTQDGLKITVERLSMCSDSGELPPQIGYFLFSDSDLYLTTSTNLLAGSFGSECMVSNTFVINTTQSISKIYYQAEDKELFSANICVFNSKIYNIGDAFVGEDGEVVVCE
jgi:hypothetical protein